MKSWNWKCGIAVSRVAYGCGDLGANWDPTPILEEHYQRAAKALEAALEAGINFFDHADIYTYGKSETIFGRFLADHPGLRERITLQSKCGIRAAGDSDPSAPVRMDFSRQHILTTVEGSLRRLGVERLDVLLLHRPDLLMEPQEVAEAFDALSSRGQVRFFGLSNHTPAQTALLRDTVRQPLIVNQIELSLLATGLLDGQIPGTKIAPVPPGAAGTLEDARLHGMALQAWSPLARGHVLGDDRAREVHGPRAVALGKVLREIASTRGVSREALALAWVLRHPAGIQPIIGSMNPERIKDICGAAEIELSREEWYRLYVAGRGENMG